MFHSHVNTSTQKVKKKPKLITLYSKPNAFLGLQAQRKGTTAQLDSGLFHMNTNYGLLALAGIHKVAKHCPWVTARRHRQT